MNTTPRTTAKYSDYANDYKTWTDTDLIRAASVRIYRATSAELQDRDAALRDTLAARIKAAPGWNQPLRDAEYKVARRYVDRAVRMDQAAAKNTTTKEN